MPRTNRVQPGGYVFHVLNRGNARMKIFEDDSDYAAFEKAMLETAECIDMRLLAYAIMPNHWHLVLRPYEDGDLGRYMHRLTTTHVRRWHQYHNSVGGGHLYQGVYKSFPVQTEKHFLILCRYVEQNALRARLVNKAENWQWSSLWRRLHPNLIDNLPPLSRWPIAEPKTWLNMVNRQQRTTEVESIQHSIQRGRPFGSETWQKRTAKRLNLESTFRPRGRPPGK